MEQDAPTARDWMVRAIELAHSSVHEERADPPPLVGAIVVKDGRSLAEYARSEGDHAEFRALTSLTTEELAGATLYTTLEPCTVRKADEKIPCARRLAASGVAVVYIGMYDPNPRINRAGWKTLVDAGVTVRDFPGDLRKQVEQLNTEFIAQYRAGTGDSGEATFDFEQNGGRFEVTDTSHGSFVTRWSRAGRGAIHAYENGHGYPALAKGATSFEPIDDAGAYDFSRHAVTVPVDGVVVFPGSGGYLLAKVDEVHSGPEYGSDHTSVTISWEVRGPGPASEGLSGG